eukprot:3386108-Karenia_brevis.AAC.1
MLQEDHCQEAATDADRLGCVLGFVRAAERAISGPWARNSRNIRSYRSMCRRKIQRLALSLDFNA